MPWQAQTPQLLTITVSSDSQQCSVKGTQACCICTIAPARAQQHIQPSKPVSLARSTSQLINSLDRPHHWWPISTIRRPTYECHSTSPNAGSTWQAMVEPCCEHISITTIPWHAAKEVCCCYITDTYMATVMVDAAATVQIWNMAYSNPAEDWKVNHRVIAPCNHCYICTHPMCAGCDKVRRLVQHSELPFQHCHIHSATAIQKHPRQM